MNTFVRFFTILGREAGVIAMAAAEKQMIGHYSEVLYFFQKAHIHCKYKSYFSLQKGIHKISGTYMQPYENRGILDDTKSRIVIQVDNFTKIVGILDDLIFHSFIFLPYSFSFSRKRNKTKKNTIS